ncbi:MAG: pantetheine-phosphate adenylyltransferase [Anaerolineae bacterium]|nr:pantetheine-phosphate adenylyltransferase [Anaerolineae bacterium]
MTVAVYPGTFDPVHYGHLDIATRAAKIFDRLIISVYDRPLKTLLFTAEERLQLMREAVKDLPNVEVCTYSGLTVDHVKAVGGTVIVRGLRVISDFELEYQMALTNKKLAPEVETICLMTSLKYAFVSSSTLKEVALAGGCVDEMAPPHVARALQRKFKELGSQTTDRVRVVSLRD